MSASTWTAFSEPFRSNRARWLQAHRAPREPRMRPTASRDETRSVDFSSGTIWPVAVVGLAAGWAWSRARDSILLESGHWTCRRLWVAVALVSVTGRMTRSVASSACRR